MAKTIEKQVEPAGDSVLPPLDGVRVLVLFGGANIFGQERANLEVFRSMADLGLKARFITSRKWGRSEIQPELDRMGLEWTPAWFGYHWTRQMLGRHLGYFLRNLLGVVATSWRIWREAGRWQATHIYAPNWLFFTYAAPAILLSRLPFIFRLGDPLPTHTRFHRWVTGKLARRVDRMVCVSRFIREQSIAAGVPDERMRVIYSYPPHRPAMEVPPLPSVPAGAVVVTYLGQISEHKGVTVLVEAVEQMIGRGDNIVLWLAGGSAWAEDDSFLPQLKQRVVAAGLLERICFLGYTKNVFAVLERSDVHVCPSVFPEPLANVVNEAKLCGKPSVVFPSGGLPELVEQGVDGFICRDMTVGALVEGIEFFAQAPERRRQAGAAARRSLEEKFGRERFVRQWGAVFQKDNRTIDH